LVIIQNRILSVYFCAEIREAFPESVSSRTHCFLNPLDISLSLALTRHLSQNFDTESDQVLINVNTKYHDIAMSRTCASRAASTYPACYLRAVVR
jgi:hypothetical protein